MLVGWILSFLSMFTSSLYAIIGTIVSPLTTMLSFVQQIFDSVLAMPAFVTAMGWVKFLFPADVLTIVPVILLCETAFLAASTALSLIRALRYWVMMKG